MIYQYKGKQYELLYEAKIKVEGHWEDCVIYKCLYDNPDGMIWVRFKYDFGIRFKPL